MPSFCQDLKTSYEHLQKLMAEFAAKYSDTKESGDLRVLKKLQKDLEGARDSFLKHISFFIVPDAKNPHHEALMKAGLDLTETQEQQEMTLDIRKEIQRQLEVYREAKDSSGNPCLEEWVKDMRENERLLYAAIAKDRDKIAERIKAGMIPVVMPGRDVQMRTWEVALLNLKPICVENGTENVLDRQGSLDDSYKTDATKKMTIDGFFKHIPDRPYLVWVKPTQETDPDTTDQTFNDQGGFYETLIEKYPKLYEPTDLIPTEYVALQAMFTSSILEQFRKRTKGTTELKDIEPLDIKTATRFLSEGPFSCHLDVPSAGFYLDSLQVYIGSDLSEVDDVHGFRPASRT